METGWKHMSSKLIVRPEVRLAHAVDDDAAATAKRGVNEGSAVSQRRAHLSQDNPTSAKARKHGHVKHDSYSCGFKSHSTLRFALVFVVGYILLPVYQLI